MQPGADATVRCHQLGDRGRVSGFLHSVRLHGGLNGPVIGPAGALDARGRLITDRENGNAGTDSEYRQDDEYLDKREPS
jgi:hypothetical protein